MQLKADSLKSIIKAGIDGDVVIIGFPFHIGAKREDLLPLGQDHGPGLIIKIYSIFFLKERLID